MFSLEALQPWPFAPGHTSSSPRRGECWFLRRPLQCSDQAAPCLPDRREAAQSQISGKVLLADCSEGGAGKDHDIETPNPQREAPLLGGLPKDGGPSAVYRFGPRKQNLQRFFELEIAFVAHFFPVKDQFHLNRGLGHRRGAFPQDWHFIQGSCAKVHVRMHL